MSVAWVAAGATALAAGSAAYSADQQKKAAKKAAKTQKKGVDASIASQEKMFNKSLAYQKEAEARSREDIAPWRRAGVNALNKLRPLIDKGPGSYTQSPGYQARVNEGEQAIDRGMAARGGFKSGAAMKALDRFNQDYATNDYDNFLNRYYQSLTPLQSMAGLGQTSAGQMSGNSMASGAGMANTAGNFGNNVSNLNMVGANARASGYINQANAATGNVNNLVNTGLAAYGMYSQNQFNNALLNQNQAQTQHPVTYPNMFNQ